jgi:hypothetical protein
MDCSSKPDCGLDVARAEVEVIREASTALSPNSPAQAARARARGEGDSTSIPRAWLANRETSRRPREDEVIHAAARSSSSQGRRDAARGSS